MTTWKYMRIEIEEGSLKKALEKYEPVGITFLSTLYFKDCFIVLIDDGMTTE